MESMLSTIKASFIDSISTNDQVNDGVMDMAANRRNKIKKFLEEHPYILNVDVRALGIYILGRIIQLC